MNRQARRPDSLRTGIAVVVAALVAVGLAATFLSADRSEIDRLAGENGGDGTTAGGTLPAAVTPPPTKPASARSAASWTACLQPVGAHDDSLLAPVAAGITQAYGFSVRVLEPMPLPESAWYAPRQRYRAENLLYHLYHHALPIAPDCDAVIGFTAVDVSVTMGEHPDWGVFGLAYLGNRVGVVSSFRMRRNADRRRIVERAVKVVIHELGHVVGVPHRDDGPGCAMNDAGGSVRSIDRAHGTLCAAERAVAEARLGFALPDRDGLDWEGILAADR